MQRRTFLIRAGQTILAAPVVLNAISCGDDGGGPAAVEAPGFDVTSSSALGHAHRIRFRCAALDAGTLTYTSTTDSNHRHDLVLSMDELARILNDESVGPITSTVAGGHTHTWTVQKPSGECP